jgi:hypothetical protein
VVSSVLVFHLYWRKGNRFGTHYIHIILITFFLTVYMIVRVLSQSSYDRSWVGCMSFPYPARQSSHLIAMRFIKPRPILHWVRSITRKLYQGELLQLADLINVWPWSCLLFYTLFWYTGRISMGQNLAYHTVHFRHAMQTMDAVSV